MREEWLFFFRRLRGRRFIIIDERDRPLLKLRLSGDGDSHHFLRLECFGLEGDLLELRSNLLQLGLAGAPRTFLDFLIDALDRRANLAVSPHLVDQEVDAGGGALRSLHGKLGLH